MKNKGDDPSKRQHLATIVHTRPIISAPSSTKEQQRLSWCPKSEKMRDPENAHQVRKYDATPGESGALVLSKSKDAYRGSQKCNMDSGLVIHSDFPTILHGRMKFLHNICQGRAITMDCQEYIKEPAERKKGQHLQREERGAIQRLKNAGYSNRAIARAIGCSPTTVGKRTKARHAPKEQQGQETRLLSKAWRGGLQGEQKAFSETTPNLSLHSFHSLDNGTGQRTQVVSGCLRWLCPSA